MQVVHAESGTIVTLPLAQTDPWPGPVGIALAIPLVLVGLIGVAAAGLFGAAGPWLIGAAPIASLFVPLAWLVRRSRHATATLVLDSLALRVVHAGRAPEFRAASMRAAVAQDRLSVEDGAQRVELALEPLDGDEVRTLREVLRALTQKG